MKIEKAIKQPKFNDAYQKLVVNLFFTSNWLRDAQNSIMKQYDILPQHYNVLRILKGKHPEASCPGDIKEVMIDKGNDVTRLLDKLVHKGLVKRSLCEENRRKMDVSITKEGLQLLNDIESPLQDHLAEIKRRVSTEEAEIMSSLLDKMRG
ncbi:MarR family transcriptional regulator [Chitinophagaceae bacterium LB-8]|uniref:MarR family transcriptional regulator n=1 Tax=Paraflavisolibacter caeni TaxID=2982496 RepID=A0A9X3B930_9BACT|nr:MarR family transcriptional regulator [Paraflavisolibacter caeni]MCU7551585.1 MarR family transcriptional regulator [Paraflavisolibacter caeni]